MNCSDWRNLPSVIDEKWRIETDKGLLGEGSFGRVYRGRLLKELRSKDMKCRVQTAAYARDVPCPEFVAIKVEKAYRKTSSGGWELVDSLGVEASTLTTVLEYYQSSMKGIPYPLFYKSNLAGFNVLVTPVMGPSLMGLFEAHRERSNLNFSYITMARLGVQIVTRIQSLHMAGIIHRDIKPDNFLMGLYEQDKDTLHIIDFGLSNRWRNKGKHLPKRESLSMVGTARYASVNAHRGLQSKRDDMLATVNVLLYFLLDQLPWQGLKYGDPYDTMYKNILEKKERTDMRELCRLAHAEELHVMWDKLRTLAYEDQPNYRACQEILISGICRRLPIFYLTINNPARNKTSSKKNTVEDQVAAGTTPRTESLQLPDYVPIPDYDWNLSENIHKIFHKIDRMMTQCSKYFNSKGNNNRHVWQMAHVQTQPNTTLAIVEMDNIKGLFCKLWRDDEKMYSYLRLIGMWTAHWAYEKDRIAPSQIFEDREWLSTWEHQRMQLQNDADMKLLKELRMEVFEDGPRGDRHDDVRVMLYSTIEDRKKRLDTIIAENIEKWSPNESDWVQRWFREEARIKSKYNDSRKLQQSTRTRSPTRDRRATGLRVESAQTTATTGRSAENQNSAVIDDGMAPKTDCATGTPMITGRRAMEAVPGAVSVRGTTDLGFARVLHTSLGTKVLQPLSSATGKAPASGTGTERRTRRRSRRQSHEQEDLLQLSRYGTETSRSHVASVCKSPRGTVAKEVDDEKGGAMEGPCPRRRERFKNRPRVASNPSNPSSLSIRTSGSLFESLTKIFRRGGSKPRRRQRGDTPAVSRAGVAARGNFRSADND